MPSVTTSIVVNTELWAAVQDYAQKNDRSKSWVVSEALRQFFGIFPEKAKRGSPPAKNSSKIPDAPVDNQQD